jgi:hypothetical protein
MRQQSRIRRSFRFRNRLKHMIAKLKNRLIWTVTVSLLSWIAPGFLRAQPSLRITSPADQAIVHPGESLTVTVETSPPTGAFQLVYLVGFEPIGFSKEKLNAPPYRFTVQIPTHISPREYLVTAVGSPSPGHLVNSRPITIVVERSDPPARLRVEPAILDLLLSQQGYLRVLGEFAEGTTTDLTQSSRIAYASSTPAVATVKAGIVTPVAPGSGKIIISYGTVRAEVQLTVRGNNRR